MSELKKQLLEQDGFIREILAISNSPALSLGVLHKGNFIHTAHYGTREVGKNLPPNDDTIYRIASLTKALTSSAVAMLVDDGKLNWDTPIREYLPDFKERHDEIGLKATVRDLLCNRTGLAAGDFHWGQQYGEFLLPHNELVRIAAHTPAVKPFREKFVYAGWNYGLVTEIVEAVAGMTLGQFIDKRFLKPLGMSRTTLADTYGYDNIALGYGLDADSSCHHIPFPQMNDGIGLAGAYGGKSSIKDILLMYKGLLSAQQDQAKSGAHTSPCSPFTYTTDIFNPHINVFGSTSYCLGLYKTTLPGLLGIASLNTISWLGPKNSPVMGETRKGLEIWHHTGSMPVCLASAFLVPETQTAVVVITNAVGFMDPTDFVAQQLLAVIIGEKLNGRLLDLAKAARASNLDQYPKLHAKLLKGRIGKSSRLAESYEGHYWNKAGNFCLTIVSQPGKGLRMKVQDVPRTGYNLEPYDGDVWWWPPDRKEELCEKGMIAYMHPGYHLISFSSSTSEQLDRLTWHHDPTAGPETFYRRDEKPRWKGYFVSKAHL
ncbi:hypothetical protein MMC13_004234 [Lambiella insularis]|nr:hypothetical protein [Lambiella insularis]